jgi:hypothetical protein
MVTVLVTLAAASTSGDVEEVGNAKVVESSVEMLKRTLGVYIFELRWGA